MTKPMGKRQQILAALAYTHPHADLRYVHFRTATAEFYLRTGDKRVVLNDWNPNKQFDRILGVHPWYQHGWISKANYRPVYGTVNNPSICWARAHVYDMVGDAQLGASDRTAAIAAWMGGQWELACEIVSEATGLDVETLKASKRPD